MPKRQNVTSKRVAEAAGVSQTTVSFVLNNVGNQNISEKTRQRVLEVANELGYVPDVAARNLARGSSTNIGLILTKPHAQVFIDEYIPNILTGLSQVSRVEGYRILVEILENDNQTNAYVDLIRGREVAGVIVNFGLPTQTVTDELAKLIEDGFPIVSLADVHPRIPSVTTDKLDGVEQVVKHIVSLEHKRIACIPYGPIDEPSHIADRLNVFRGVLARNHVPFYPELVCAGNFDPDTGYEAMKILLTRRPLPTALYAMNDVMAFGAMKAIAEAGLRVPEDMAVVGFDDIRLAAFSSPALTTVREPDVDHGRLAGEMLMALIKGRPLIERHVSLKTEVKIRDSCGYKLRNA